MEIPKLRRPAMRPANVLGTAILSSALAAGCARNASDSGGPGSAELPESLRVSNPFALSR